MNLFGAVDLIFGPDPPSVKAVRPVAIRRVETNTIICFKRYYRITRYGAILAILTVLLASIGMIGLLLMM